MKYKKILVAVDGSSHATRAAKHALDLSKLMDSEVVLVHCHKPFPDLLGEPFLQTSINKIREKAEQLMEPYRDMFYEAEKEFSERILQGPAREKITDVARIEKCDLIVMGSRGRTNLEGLILGSVAHRVLHATPCPVLVVRGMEK